MKDIFDNIFSANSPDVNIIPVMNIDNMQSLKETEMPPVLPILTLRNAILFPETVIPVTIGNIIGGAVFVGMSYWGAYLRPVKPTQS